ncbi:MAG: helix-turn-helix transcriptional regulator [Thermodesulfobacteriota bacterium]
MSTKKQTISANFSKKLKLARQQKGFTQGQLARRVGSDSQRISKYERGVMVPTTPILIKIANALEVSLDYLLLDAEDKAVSKIQDATLLSQFTQIESLTEEDKFLIKGLLDAFIKKSKFEMLAHS